MFSAVFNKYGASKHLTLQLLLAYLVKFVKSEEMWSDSRSYTCVQYKSMGFCKSGSYGPNWRFDVDGVFRDYADADGFDASDRCCECIPSTSHTFSHLGCTPRDEPDNSMWIDIAGHSCSFYRQHGWCKNFGYGQYGVLFALRTCTGHRPRLCSFFLCFIQNRVQL